MTLLFCRAASGDRIVQPEQPELLLPGSFNPLHQGHRELALVVERVLEKRVDFELSVANVDKPDLPEEEVDRRVSQFSGMAPIWVTRAATFVQKAQLFPGCGFVIGHDTATRIFDAKYYGEAFQKRDAALERLLELGCHFVVGGRLDLRGEFRVWHPEIAPARYRSLFTALQESQFRRDLSSTELRAKRT